MTLAAGHGIALISVVVDAGWDRSNANNLNHVNLKGQDITNDNFTVNNRVMSTDEVKH